MERLTLHAGDTWDPGFAATENDGVTPVDLTDWVLTCNVTKINHVLIAEGAVEILDAVEGLGKVVIEAAVTELIPAGVYLFNIRRTRGAEVRSNQIAELEVLVPPTMLPVEP